MKADVRTETAVMNVIKLFFKAFCRRSLDAMLSFFAPGPDVVFIGTGRDEKAIGHTKIKSLFERALLHYEKASVKFGWHSVSASDSLV